MAQENTLRPTPGQAGLELGSKALTSKDSQVGLRARLTKRLLLSALEHLEIGELVLADGDERHAFGRLTEEFPIRGSLRVLDPGFYVRVLTGGSIGAGEAYADGLWTADNLTNVIRILARNRAVLERMEGGLAKLSNPLQRLSHRLRDNSVSGSRRNITAHYDLGNDFFALFLDPTMMYSSAVFPDWTSRLDQASLYKLDLICRKLDLRPQDEVIEIGTGWGGFALHAARNYGSKIVTTTISQRQYDYARERVAEEGLEDRITVLLEDYRDLSRATKRRFDKLVSIEMIEAVGHERLPTYFETVDGLLEPHGIALIQAITIRDHQYESYRRSVDFIQRHIFPGGLLPSLARMSECLQHSTEMIVTHLEDLTPHYATTLAAWRRRFLEHRSEISSLGLDEVFQRLWEFYFCYCEGAFRERLIGSVQLICTKPLNRSQPIATTI